MTSALFGPDGTQPPEPQEVLPDALALTWLPLAEGGAGSRAVRRPVPPGQPIEAAVTPPTGVPAQRLQPPRRPPPPSPPRQPPPRAATQPRPAAPGYQPPFTLPPVPTVAPPLDRPPHRPRPPAPRAMPSQPSLPARPPAPSRPRQPASRPADRTQPGRTVAAQRRRDRKNPLIQGKRSSGTNWMGCIVFLVFLVAAFFNSVQSLVNALLDLVR